jgi:hypothetical protein
MGVCIAFKSDSVCYCLQTVPVSQVTQMAKPLPKQTIDKGKVGSSSCWPHAEDCVWFNRSSTGIYSDSSTGM